MMAKVPHRPAGPSLVTVRAADLALQHLPLNRYERVLGKGEVHDAATFGSNVVEVQDHDVPLAAIRAWVGFENLDQEPDVALPEWPGTPCQASLRVHSPGVGAVCSPTSMAIDADHLTSIEFVLESSNRIAMRNEIRDVKPLRTNVIELEHHRVSQSTVRARALRKEGEDVTSGKLAPFPTSFMCLAPMKFTALMHVDAPAVTAPRLSLVKS
jgi:hypothetical protein